MIRTKYLFIFILVCAVVVLVYGIWTLSKEEDNQTPFAITGELFFGEGKDEYPVAQDEGDNTGTDRESFIAKIRSALINQNVDETPQSPDASLYSQSTTEVTAEPMPSESPTLFMQASAMSTEGEPAPTEASTTPPSLGTTTAQTGMEAEAMP